MFDCLSFCCGQPASCDKVCRNNPNFPDRVREIGGFTLDTVPRRAAIAAPHLPRVVPVLFHGKRRDTVLAPGTVALSLYQMFDRRDGRLRFTSRESLCAAYGIELDTTIILTGTDQDPPLERWWGLGSKRREIIRILRAIGVALVTTPNYSLFLDVPRWDDLHSMKRIAIVHSEFLGEGIPTALHVNGRTDHDFLRWTEYVGARHEITHLAYEFTTGTGWRGRREQHAKWLSMLAAAVGRPLSLVIRGGADMLPVLSKTFAHVSLLETSAFMKTMMRRRAVPKSNGHLKWQASPTVAGEPLDSLLKHNLQMVETALMNTPLNRAESEKSGMPQ